VPGTTNGTINDTNEPIKVLLVHIDKMVDNKEVKLLNKLVKWANEPINEPIKVLLVYIDKMVDNKEAKLLDKLVEWANDTINDTLNDTINGTINEKQFLITEVSDN
jgi:GTP-binding protein EngB required for normal cell division